ncbi:hypothetical protein [Paenibacillus antarcticus]|uniref:Uncharacterized protein n=1 Tax=Paenibacillus antarcticus TaxID=253703 RepID=A0A168KJ98_9BACL|nr:hypothetical protein [Paenibacillus antarcticus]OAB42094.1 hypothetical protein PBAT_20440 [Paenibacillus antarcticus]
MLYKENSQNQDYERYFSQSLSNDQSELIGSILYSREEVNNILSAKFSPETKNGLIYSVNRISMNSQDFDYFAKYFDLIDPHQIQNSTSEVAMHLEYYFRDFDPTTLTKEDKEKLKDILVLLNQWVDVIDVEYDGITYQNQNEVISNVLNDNRKDFFGSDVWRNIIVGLDRVSKDNITFAKSIEN